MPVIGSFRFLAYLVVILGALGAASFVAVFMIGRGAKGTFSKVQTSVAGKVDKTTKIDPPETSKVVTDGDPKPVEEKKASAIEPPVADPKTPSAKMTTPAPPEDEPKPAFHPKDDTRSPRIAVATVRSPRKSLMTRVGGRLSQAIANQEYYVRYQPIAPLGYVGLAEAVKDKSFAFQVRPFALGADPLPEGAFAIERGEEIIAAALAQQLESMGFEIVMDLGSLLPELRETLEKQVDTDPNLFATKVVISGRTRFWVQHGRASDDYTSTAAIDGELTFTAGERDVMIHRKPLSESVVESAKKATGAAERARKAAARVLEECMISVFDDKALHDALLAFVRNAAKK